MNKHAPCPCQSGLSYTLCCGRYHKGNLYAPTAEALMRSRYTAYALGDAQYLYRTWHESTRPSLVSLRESGPLDLIGLKIISTMAGGENDSKGMVEFVASSKSTSMPGEIEQHREKSLFVRVKSRWVYIDAI